MLKIKRIGIFGTSGMAKEVGDIAYELGYKPIYIAKNNNEMITLDATEDILNEIDLHQYKDMSFVVGVGDNRIRQNIAHRYTNQLKFCNLIHPSATFGLRQKQIIESKRGVIICAGVRFTNNIRVGNFCIFNLNSTISHDVVLEEAVFIASGVHIAGNVHIKARSWVGTGAIINQGSNSQKLNVGPDTIVGSGAVVLSDCERDSIYLGIPARKITCKR